MSGNPFGKYNGNELDYVRHFLEGSWTHGGIGKVDWVAKLESEFNKKIGGKYAIAVNSGTSALHAALVACNVKGGEVLMPALCPAMVAFAIIHAGATPVFCDVDPETHHISQAEISDKITNNTKAILGVSLHGLPMNWNGIKFPGGVYLIDDCAQALGAKGIGQADITCFSFEDKKHITTGSEGGMILTNNEKLAICARKFAGLGYKHMTAELGRTSLAKAEYQDPSYERFDTIGLNYRMSQIQAAVGLAQLERLDHIVARRRAVAALYVESIKNKQIGYSSDFLRHSFYTLPIKYDGDWKDFYNRFIEMGGDGFYAMPQMPYKEPAFDKYYAYTIHGHKEYTNQSNIIPDWHFQCPIAEDLQKKLMLFKTNYRDLGKAEQQAEILAKLIGEL